MYAFILALHSLLRWGVLASLLYAIARAYAGWIGKKKYTKQDNTARTVAASFAHLQLVVGVVLYFISPIVKYFLQNFKTAVHERQIRFFGMEHNIVMIVGIIVITIGSILSKRGKTDTQRFRIMAICYLIGLLIILSSIPWPSSPMVARPWFRGF